MGMTAMIGLGTVCWILLAIPIALLVARMIRLRDCQRSAEVEPATPAQRTSTQGGHIGADEPVPRSTGWRRRIKILRNKR
ncbi:MAG: hypothetical protein ACRDSR_01235 [Pseudonocardiaceae bacterium]